MFQIESGIPIPPRRSPNIAVYPFAEMNVGDSFFVPKSDGGTVTAALSRVQSAAGAHSRRHGGKFSIRRQDDGVRVWRAA